ncbi:MAG: MerR family transcriptional regulator [Lachnospiraceae bacterium]|nr:MerR family transcriptional regulator [Lachnospiraceae bacterium]
MKEPYYTIKEASARVGVESHVLRYWEEELKMDIHRNQMGHRYYTDHDIDLLCMVHKLKDKGLQLKAIRSYIDKRQEQIMGGETGEKKRGYINDEMLTGGNEGLSDAGKHLDNKHIGYMQDIREEERSDTGQGGQGGYENTEKNELVPVKTGRGIMSNAEKLEQFQRIMNRILSNAIQENNELIGRSAGEHAASAVVTQIQGMTKEQEERAEERYRKLDQTLREIQLARKEAAAASMRPVDRRRQQRLKRKNKNKKEEVSDNITNSMDEAKTSYDMEAASDIEDTSVDTAASANDMEDKEIKDKAVAGKDQSNK